MFGLDLTLKLRSGLQSLVLEGELYFALNPYLCLYLVYILSLNFLCTLELAKKFLWWVVVGDSGGCVNLF